ncbi:hypothetical protein ACEWY4_020839 [Coilia grayii]|uniref:Ig-like domain-containing protein n=1 Tax=Coilia grayii TaxID=363190 RepID=A0ABD1J7A2_9TELE
MTSNQQGSYRCQFEFSGTKIMSSQSDTIAITVVNLTQPSISISSSKGRGLCPDVHLNQRSEVSSLEVTRGHAFFISCSTESEHANGYFLLQHSGSNTTHTQRSSSSTLWTQHSACFLFPVADDSHQGNYSCVYQVTVASRNFTSAQTHAVIVTVKASYLLPLLVAAGGLILLILLLSILLLWRCRHGNRDRAPSIRGDVMRPDGDQNYRSNEPVEDDERDYESLDDDDGDNYVNTETLLGSKKSLGEEEDYVNTESLGGTGQDLDEVEEDYVNTESLGGTGQDLDEAEEDYVNTETLAGGQDYECMDKDLEAEDYECMDKDLEAEDYECMDKDLEADDYECIDTDLEAEDYECMNELSEQADEEDYVNVHIH